MTTLKTILYFSIFDYPITRDEIFKFSNSKDINEIDKEISDLLNKQIIFKIEEFYLKTNSPLHIRRRLAGNKMAKDIMQKAIRVSKKIASFPYVNGVALSGSISKGYFDHNDDIDFFIITNPNRLWIARTFLIIYKKIFLLNSKKYFCVNYFISSNNLKIEEENKFTAMELVTLLPIYGQTVFSEFVNKNQWASNYFPNKNIEENFKYVKDIQKSKTIRFIEFIFNTWLGDFLEHLFRKITLKKWRMKFKKLSEEDFKIAMKTTKSVSKHHPQNFQKKVIKLLNKSYNEVEKEHNLFLEKEYA